MFSPEWAYNVNIDYRVPVGDILEARATFSLSYSDEFFAASDLDPIYAAQDACTMYDLRLGLGSRDGTWNVAVVGENLSYELISGNTNDQPLVPGNAFASTERRRSYALQATYRSALFAVVRQAAETNGALRGAQRSILRVLWGRRSAMTVRYQDKPIERLREEVIDQLIMNYGHGELSLEAFERRLDEAYEHRDHEALKGLTDDLSLQVDEDYTAKKKQELGFEYSRDKTKDTDWMINILGGSDRAGTWSVPRELRVITVMGGADIDLTEARFAHREVKIRVFCLMGGVDIKVPEQVTVESKVVPIMGGVDNKASIRNSNGSDAPHIVVEGLVLMGGLDIKIKRRIRENWLRFADELRSFFGFPTHDERRNAG